MAVIAKDFFRFFKGNRLKSRPATSTTKPKVKKTPKENVYSFGFMSETGWRNGTIPAPTKSEARALLKKKYGPLPAGTKLRLITVVEGGAV